MTTRTYLTLMLAALLPLAAGAADWTSDYDQALKQAKEQDKFVLLDFSGSDWCGWCIRLDKEVFSQSAFKDYAKDNLVPVLLDFPRRKKLPADVAQRNRQLAQKFGVRGYPTIILLDGEGKLVARTGYKRGGAEAYVQHLEALLEPHQKQETSATDDDQGPSARTWTDSMGRAVTGTLASHSDAEVKILLESGETVNLPWAKLSLVDKMYIEKFAGK